jgi:hypothetical protein
MDYTVLHSTDVHPDEKRLPCRRLLEDSRPSPGMIGWAAFQTCVSVNPSVHVSRSSPSCSRPASRTSPSQSIRR